MLATLLTAALLCAAPTADETPLAWFEGTWAEALALAEAEQRPLFVEFWRDDCGWCKQLHAETFPDPAVRKALEAFVRVAVDKDSEQGQELAKTFNLKAMPAMFFLDSAARIEDVIFGFMAAEDFAIEVTRVRNGEGTFSALEARIEEDPLDLDAHYALANKKWSLGDSDGYYHHLHVIERADPGLHSLPMRRMVLAGLQEELYGCRFDDGVLDPTRLLSFLEAEQHEELLFEGWSYLARVQATEQNGAAARRAFAGAWQHVPHARRAPFGHEIVWTLWQLRAGIDAGDSRWVLAVATEANELFEQAGGGTDAARADYLDILACAHYMSGDRERAIEVGERSLKLAPARSDIRQRVSVFKLER